MRTRRRLATLNKSAKKRNNQKFSVKFRVSESNKCDVLNVTVVTPGKRLCDGFDRSGSEGEKNNFLKYDEKSLENDESSAQFDTNCNEEVVATPALGGERLCYSSLRQRLTSTPHHQLTTRQRLPTASTPVTGSLASRVDKFSPVVRVRETDGGEDCVFQSPLLVARPSVGGAHLFSTSSNLETSGSSSKYDTANSSKFKTASQNSSGHRNNSEIKEDGPIAQRVLSNNNTESLHFNSKKNITPCSVILTDCAKTNCDKIMINKSELQLPLRSSNSIDSEGVTKSDVQELSIMVNISKRNGQSSIKIDAFLLPTTPLCMRKQTKSPLSNTNIKYNDTCSVAAPQSAALPNSLLCSSFFAEALRCSVVPSPAITRFRKRFPVLPLSTRRRRRRGVTSLLPPLNMVDNASTLDVNSTINIDDSIQISTSTCRNQSSSTNRLQDADSFNSNNLNSLSDVNSSNITISRHKKKHSKTHRIFTRSRASRISPSSSSDGGWEDSSEGAHSNQSNNIVKSSMNAFALESKSVNDHTGCESESSNLNLSNYSKYTEQQSTSNGTNISSMTLHSTDESVTCLTATVGEADDRCLNHNTTEDSTPVYIKQKERNVSNSLSLKVDELSLLCTSASALPRARLSENVAPSKSNVIVHSHASGNSSTRSLPTALALSGQCSALSLALPPALALAPSPALPSSAIGNDSTFVFDYSGLLASPALVTKPGKGWRRSLASALNASIATVSRSSICLTIDKLLNAMIVIFCLILSILPYNFIAYLNLWCHSLFRM